MEHPPKDISGVILGNSWQSNPNSRNNIADGSPSPPSISCSHWKKHRLVNFKPTPEAELQEAAAITLQNLLVSSPESSFSLLSKKALPTLVSLSMDESVLRPSLLGRTWASQGLSIVQISTLLRTILHKTTHHRSQNHTFQMYLTKHDDEEDDDEKKANGFYSFCYAEALQLVAICIAGYTSSSQSNVWRSACDGSLTRMELNETQTHNRMKMHVPYLHATLVFLSGITRHDTCYEDILLDNRLSLCDWVTFAC